MLTIKIMILTLGHIRMVFVEIDTNSAQLGLDLGFD